ncbi:GPW/gp25 family protein [Luteibacter yeojuensis]|uniref:GPW/gp25 family protein n=1 Tax=Luteibacter yeojuensis TaxID=345309 RepID=A0A7X5QSP2_9GAMM|nr:GPW/gp25 family protein [Luteibacter yeojuensis]NID14696.1 GPW/gp25 family protein [Luteibacter yeojuensis]
MSSFLGRGWSFPPRFDPRTKEAVMVADETDIAESLHILFSTNPGERVMLPNYGCDLRRMVFEEANEQTVTEIKELMRKAILFYEPRIVLNRIEAQLVDPLNGKLEIALDYTVRGTNSRHNLVYPFYLHQATHPVRA